MRGDIGIKSAAESMVNLGIASSLPEFRRIVQDYVAEGMLHLILKPSQDDLGWADFVDFADFVDLGWADFRRRGGNHQVWYGPGNFTVLGIRFECCDIWSLSFVHAGFIILIRNGYGYVVFNVSN